MQDLRAASNSPMRRCTTIQLLDYMLTESPASTCSVHPSAAFYSCADATRVVWIVVVQRKDCSMVISISRKYGRRPWLVFIG